MPSNLAPGCATFSETSALQLRVADHFGFFDWASQRYRFCDSMLLIAGRVFASCDFFAWGFLVRLCLLGTEGKALCFFELDLGMRLKISFKFFLTGVKSEFVFVRVSS